MLYIDNELFYTSIIDEEHLNSLLLHYNLYKYIHYKQSFKSIGEFHPILLYTQIEENGVYSISSFLMNEIIEYDLIPFKALLSCFVINVFLNAYYNKI